MADTQSNVRCLTEIVGLAGSGKSTLARLLLAESNRFAPAEEIRLKRDLGQLPHFIGQTLDLLPALIRMRAKADLPDWETYRRIVYLHGWEKRLRYQWAYVSGHLLIDQGPIFEMATLHAFGPMSLHSKSWKRWWEDAYERWACMLERVICLEAPLELLLERIRNRAQRHPIQSWDDGKAIDFLIRYSEAYEKVIDELMRRAPIRVDRFDSSLFSPTELFAQVSKVPLPADRGVAERKTAGRSNYR